MSEAELDEMLAAIKAEIGDESAAVSDSAFSMFGPVPRAANDNSVAWPMIPFPDGWCASS